jgi:hypothetical protein
MKLASIAREEMAKTEGIDRGKDDKTNALTGEE